MQTVRTQMHRGSLWEPALINVVLSPQWKSLSIEEQAKYYGQADAEKRLHAQCHPEWTSGNNYGVKKKRDRSKAGKLAAELSEDVTQPAKKQRAASVCTQVVAPPPQNVTWIMETVPFRGPEGQ
ncbi:Transcription factor 7 [Liparis tanakae]|uniref:Transcription factor 7 n=1 Tax=Liparis tanakae TaxID=230148 RepID=A0A4Z2IET0_9TELE|nr:Transcription factor 7 [Liparis tanakae]